MATSESDDFESADEELNHDIPVKRGTQQRQWSSPTAVDSESDDDTEYVPRTPCTNSNYDEKSERYSSNRTAAAAGERTSAKAIRSEKDDNDTSIDKVHKNMSNMSLVNDDEKTVEKVAASASQEEKPTQIKTGITSPTIQEEKNRKNENVDENMETSKEKKVKEIRSTAITSEPKAKGRQHSQRNTESNRQLGAKKLGTRIVQDNNISCNMNTPVTTTKDEIVSEEIQNLSPKETVSTSHQDVKNSDIKDKLSDVLSDSNKDIASLMDELAEPEELKSNKKFKDIFKPQGWEALGTEIELPEELTEEKLQPVLERLSSVGQELESPSGGWGGWGSWGVSSLINTASAGVSTLTSHVSHGLTLLEESIGTPDATEPTTEQKQEESTEKIDTKNSNIPEETSGQISFGFGNLISGVSSITRLVESTGTKVMTGGLDTLEAIGKKTMEVLQEGDPGLKKKRAFFMNEADKPILSQVLREAKEKAETAEKTIEEKQQARKVHFESLFDDYQGLVHLEALEMLSKQSNIKIQQHLVNLDTNELTSVQETLDEVKELCDLGDEDEEDNDQDIKDLKLRLQEACKDLGVNISYEKLYTVWEESQSYLMPVMTHTSQDIFQSAISALAQFTAFSVERFHKTAELLLIKERRSTVNEADSLVQLTRILSNHIGVLANHYCNSLNEHMKQSEKSDDINGNITTIFMEATNASSYIQDAFRLLIPIVQVGAI